MYVSHITLKNWRNFQSVDVDLQQRTFLVGPNASGKSNFLDAFRFLRDMAQSGGGLQFAISERGGLSRIRCLAARKEPDVELNLTLKNNGDNDFSWRYSVGLTQEPRGKRRAKIKYERVECNGKRILDRPDDDDRKDEERLTQSYLEQINANAEFREIARFLEAVCYLHLVPQLVRHPREYSGPGVAGDPFGRSFLERIARTPKKTRDSRLKAIQSVLRVAVPQLTELAHIIDATEGGIPHLEAVYSHWRPYGAKQRERDFSDGTLRLIGLFWSLLEGESLLLIEEPELSLNAAIVEKLPRLIHQSQKKRQRQVLISTHSAELLSDRGIGLEQVLLLIPDSEGTKIEIAVNRKDFRDLLEEGFTVGEAILPATRPQGMEQGYFEFRS